MGKCISKHPSVLTIALSEKDLANTNQIWSKFAESSTEYMAVKNDTECRHGNQLCVHESNYFVSMPVGVRNQQSQQQQEDYNAKKSVPFRRMVVTSKPTGMMGSLKKDEKPTGMMGSLKKDEKSTTSQVTVSLDDIMMVGAVSTTHKFQRHNSSSKINTDSMMNMDEAYTCTMATAVSTSIITDEGDDRRHDFEYDDIVGYIYPYPDSYDANTSHNVEQHCLAHMNLLQNRPQPASIAKCNQRIWFEDTSGDNKNETPSTAHDKESKDARNIQNKRRFSESNLVELVFKQNMLKTDESKNNIRANEDIQGQAESKKSSKKYSTNALETKGTAMSFGFHKKLTSTPKKLKKLIEGSVGDIKSKHDKCNNLKETHRERTTKEITEVPTKEDTANHEKKDNNGNTEEANQIQFEKMGAAAWSTGQKAMSTNQGVSSVQHSNLPGANNRFGFRGITRPASTGITSRYDKKDNASNNNILTDESIETRPSCLVSNLKRRSKSAHAGRALTSDQSDDVDADGNRRTSVLAAPPKIAQPKTLTFNLSHNSTIEYQRQQFFQQPTSNASGRIGRTGGVVGGAYQQYHQQQQQQYQNIVNTGMHTNVIVRPTPRAPPASFSKFTLHTTSLPKPEFPIAISLSTTTTPTTPGCVFSPLSGSPMTAASSNSNTVNSSGSSNGIRARDSQHPLTVVAAAVSQTNYQNYMDPKAAKHVANSTTRRGFSGSREISADSGIASMDMALESSTSSGRSASPPKRSRSRPRNLQMVMSGRHKFEVRDLDDPLSSESSSIVVEPLALPKLPSESQTVPLPLSGLIRSNTVLSRDLNDAEQLTQRKMESVSMTRNLSDDSESREEKLCLDRSVPEKASKLQFRDKNLCSSKTSSPGSSIMVSWCNAAGEALATQGSSIINSITDYNDSSKTLDQIDERKAFFTADTDYCLELKDDDLSTISSDMNISPMSSNFEPINSARTYTLDSGAEISKPERPKSLCDATAIEKKFAEMALAGSAFLIDDETSPTDSLVSSTASDEVVDKKKKHKINEELQEKDIDEISPELEIGSPISPGTPTHASRSLSLSDCGNLIDDEIADQPALLFNNESQPDGLESITSRREKTDTPTLMETVSLRSLKSQSKARTALQQAIELNLRTPISLRKKVMERAESLDTLSPCESICSDDLMMDFEINSSVDSIDRSTSIKSRSGSDLHKIDETELFSEFEREGTDLMKELNTMLRTHQNNREREKSRVIAHLPARATRLLNRSRLQQQCNFNSDSPDSAKSSNSLRRGTPASSRASSNGSTQHKQHHQHSPHMQRSQRDSLSSSDDLMLYDKSFRNAMIQDVLHFKKQLLRLRRVLEETDTINPFDAENGQQVNHCGFDLTKDADLISLISSSIDEPIEDISDLRRQVVYLQSQIDDRDRTIRLQRDLIEKLEAEKATLPHIQNATDISKECNNMATQTERTRPLSIGAEGLTRSKPEYTSYTTHFPAIHNDLTSIKHQHQQQGQQQEQQKLQPQPQPQPQQQPQSPSSYSDCNFNNNNGNYNSTSKSLNQTRRHTIISTTLTNYNTQLAAQAQPTTMPRRASVAWDSKTGENFPTSTNPTVYKPVRITLIGDTLKQWNDELLALKNAQNAEKMEILNGNASKLENYNRVRHICNNGHISHSKSDDLAKNVKANVVASTNNKTVSVDIAQIAKPKYQQSNATNIHSNGNHQNSTVTIV